MLCQYYFYIYFLFEILDEFLCLLVDYYNVFHISLVDCFERAME